MKISENTYQIEELTKENARLKQEIEELQARHIYIEGKLREELDRQQNILEQKLSIESLGNENDICRRIVEVANEGMWVYDTLGKTIFVNKRITELLGFSQEEMIGKTAFEFMDAESKALAEIKIEQRLKGVKEQYQQKFIKKDNSILWATVVSSALFGENGNVEAILTMLTDITEQKLMDIALQESENRFRSLVTASSEVLYRMNADWSEMLQLKGQGFLANTEAANPDWLQEYIHPDDQEHVTAVIQKAIECKNIFELEHRVKRENGKWGWTLSRAVPILDSNGEIIEWFGAAIDFTERKEAEDRIQELLRLSEQRSAELNAVIEAMPDAVYIGNLEGITLCNNSALRMLGASSLKDLQERIGELGKKFNVRWPDTGRQLREDELQFTRALMGETVIEEVLATNAQTGKDVYIRAADAPIIINGEIAGAVAVNSDITDRVNAEEALKKSKQEYELLFNSIEEGFAHYKAIYDVNGRLDDLLVIEINPAGAKLSGVKREEQIGKTWKNMWTGIEDHLFDIYREVDKNGGPFRFEHFSGITQRWYSNIIYKIGEDQFAVTFYDITERKHAEEEAKSKTTEIEAILSCIADGVMVYDHQGRVIRTNSTADNLMKYHKEQTALSTKERVSKEFSLWTEDGRSLNVEEMPAYRASVNGETIRNEVLLMQIGGEHRWINISAAPLIVAGKHAGGVASLSDITERKKAEEALRLNEQRLRSIFDNAAIGITETDSTDHFIDINNQLCKMLGYTREELKNKSIYELTYTDDMPQTIEMNNRLHSGELKIFSYEKRYLKKDGTPIWVHVTASAIMDLNGKFIKSVNTIEDITERKNAEETVRRSEAILKQAGNMANLGAWEIEIINSDNVNKNPLYWSDQVYRIFGYEPGSVNASNDLFYEHVHPDDRQKISDTFNEAIKKKRVLQH